MDKGLKRATELGLDVERLSKRAGGSVRQLQEQHGLLEAVLRRLEEHEGALREMRLQPASQPQQDHIRAAALAAELSSATSPRGVPAGMPECGDLRGATTLRVAADVEGALAAVEESVAGHERVLAELASQVYWGAGTTAVEQPSPRREHEASRQREALEATLRARLEDCYALLVLVPGISLILFL